MTFKELDLIEPILKALQQTGYTTPTPIQEQAIPVLLKGKDLLGCAQTGTGKTAAFAIPLIQRLYQSDHKKGIKALILTPTRELAIQIGENFDQYAKYTGVKHAVIFGGVPQKAQVDALKRGVQVLIATPGRLLDLQSQGCISLKGLEYFVLDEADRMLDMGFIHDIKKVLKLIPARRQTLFFSATMPSEIEKLADSMLTNPKKVEVTPVSSTVDTIQQSVYFVEKKEKKDLLLHLLKNPEIESVLIFTRTKHGADKLAKILNKSEIGAEAIHGNKSQNARQRALTNFKDHTTRVLIATDIAARGIDVNQLSHVTFDVVYGGGEANVAVSCANYGHEAYFVTKLPKHEIGQSAVNALRKYGVKTDFISRGGDRVGIYYLETGASMRPSKVIYDRAHSAIAEADPCDFDFDAIMEGADWFHWSGITPAISDKAAELTRLACEAAKRHGVTVSVDLNFRKKLWTKEKAQSIMKPLMQYVDVCIGNEEDAELCLGFKPEANVEAGETNAEGYKGIFKAMAKEFGFKYVVSTLRESFSATHNGWKAMIYNGEEFYESKRYDINPIIDRVGGGDSFSGGIIHGLLTKPNQGAALEFAVAASALKHTINGDFNLVSVDEVEALAGGDASGRVQR